MADKEAKKDEAEGEESAEKKKAIPMSLIIGAVAALIFAIGLPVTILMLKGGDASEEEENPVTLEEGRANEIQIEGYNDEDEYDENEEPLGAMYPLETFVVNLTKGGYLRIQIQLEFDDRDVPRRFYSRLVLVRDAVITLLSSRTAEEIGTPNGKGDLKVELKELVNEILRKQLVKDVYFTQFVVRD